MKRPFVALCAVLALTCALPTGASAQNRVLNTMVFHNKSDAWVWVTGYGRWGDILGKPFCINPGVRAQYAFTGTYVYEVRAEVARQGCSHPLYADWRRGYPYGQNEVTYTYYVKGTNGHYTYDEQP